MYIPLFMAIAIIANFPICSKIKANQILSLMKLQ